MNEHYYRDNPHGPGGFGDVSDAQALLNGNGPPLGLLGNRVLRFVGDEPRILIGGAGSSKFARQGIYTALSPAVHSMFTLDVGGQYHNVTHHAHLAMRRESYCINPKRLGRYGLNHPTNPLAFLKDDEHLFSNALLAGGWLIPNEKHAHENSWVGEEGARWVMSLLLILSLTSGASLPKLWRMINAFDSDDEYIKRVGREVMGLPYDVGETVLEIYTKKKTSEREYGAVMGHIKDKLLVLADPLIAESLEGESDYLPKLADANAKVSINLIIPPEMTEKWSFLARLVVGAAMVHCQRANNGTRPLFNLDEAATMKGAAFVKTAVSVNRKYHDTQLVYQSLGQIEQHFGPAGAQEILSSCGIQQFPGGGIRDNKTAEYIERKVGRVSAELIDPERVAHHQFEAGERMRDAFWFQKNPITAIRRARHEKAMMHEHRHIGRAAMDAAEAQRMSTDKQLVFAPGLGIPPLLADKLPPYWLNPAMAGKYAPDPLYPPIDRVRIAGRFGARTRKFMSVAVPAHLSDWPNVAHGELNYVDGYKTW